MLAELREYFFKYSPWLILVPAIIIVANGLWKVKQLKPLTLYLALAVITQGLSLALWLKSINNMPLLHIYTVFEFLVLLWFYYCILNIYLSARLFLVTGLCFVAFAATDSIFIENILAFNILGRSMEALIIILFSLYCFLRLITVEDHTEMQNTVSIKYLNIAFFIYFSGSIALFSLSALTNNFGRSLALNIWSIHTILLVLMYVFITIGLLKWKKVLAPILG